MTTRTWPDPTVDRLVVAAYRAGVPVATIAEQHDLAESTVYRVLQRRGMPRGRRDGVSWGRLLTEDLLRDAVTSGLTRHGLARQVGCPQATVTWWAAVHQVTEYTPVHLLMPEDRRRLVDRYRAGASVAALSAEYGHTRRTVIVLLRALGVELRPVGRPVGQSAGDMGTG